MATDSEVRLELSSPPVSEAGFKFWLQNLSIFLQAGFEVADARADAALQEADALDEPVRNTFERAENVIRRSDYRNG